ncbi:MAG TPA: hypothetical protein VIL22_04115 [Paenibacillaceae bacterium]
MTYRSLDLQPITRTPEIAQLQHQQQYRSTHEQMMQAGMSVRMGREQAQRTNRGEEAAGAAIRERESRAKREPGQGQGKRKESEAKAAREANLHPYKGRHVDLTL